MKCRNCHNQVEPRATGRPPRYCSTRCRMVAYRQRKRGYQEPRQHRLSVHFSSKTCEWATPQAEFERLNTKWGPFTLDPCATVENAKCVNFFTRQEDGLAQPWTGRVFCNPPYGRPLAAWMQKAWEASQTTAEVVVCLVPARTDTRWWHEFAVRGTVEYLPGRLRFGGAPNGAPFPSVVIVFRNANERQLGA